MSTGATDGHWVALRDRILPQGKMREDVRALRTWLRAVRAGRVRDRRPATTFIAVTGSAGKTTTTQLLGHLLAAEGVVHLHALFNTTKSISKSVGEVPVRARFACFEVSGHAPGAIDEVTRYLRPQIGIVTRVLSDHRTNFRGEVSVAQEKERLVASLPADGWAVLNADDPAVAEMAGRSPAQVRTFGANPSADVRALDISAALPGTLSFTVLDGDDSARIETELVGGHWVSAVLAAIAAARLFGLPLSVIAERVRDFSPHYRRCSPHRWGEGSLLVLDDWKAPFQSLETAFDILKDAAAPRRTIVLGTISDYPGAARPKYMRAYEMARARADRLIMTGPQHGRVRPREEDVREGRFHAFATPQEAGRHLRSTAIPGEVVLVKASGIDELGPGLELQHV